MRRGDRDELMRGAVSVELTAGILSAVVLNAPSGSSSAHLDLWLVALVTLAVAARAVQIWVYTREPERRWRRSLVTGFTLSMFGWAGLIVLCAGRLLVPDFQAPLTLYLLAFAMHLGGAAWLMRELR